MNRPLLLIIAAVLALPACKKAEPENLTPVRETVAGAGLIDFDSPSEKFTCRAPGDWKIQETSVPGQTDSVTFIGTPIRRGMPFIQILQYPTSKNDVWKDARKYAESFWEITPDNKQPVLETKKIGDKDVIFFHDERPFRKIHSTKIEYMERRDHALIPVNGGFFEICHTAPVSSYQESLPVFEAVVKSFKPKS